ncbi:phage tail terminator family protein [Companilactobacillus sp. HBUAS59699]|uniref:phage tail terminator family protein n=1 Tax=Companilactobacillus sp. HBUAS59699 TaxID=3109358 RepID=UPI002FF14392
MKVSIIDLIGNELSKLFPNIPIYRENQKGGFKEPSFFVEKIITNVNPELFDIQSRSYSYQLVYFPKLDEPKTDIEIVEEILLDNFTQLTDYAVIRNRDFKQSDDNTLLLTFNIQIRAHKIDVSAKQQNMKFKGKITDERDVY